MTWDYSQGHSSIAFHKPDVIPEVWLDPSPSRNDIQSMINYALERQTKTTDKLLRRLIEEREGQIGGEISSTRANCKVERRWRGS
jgi:hypothetical protein